jgi:arylsulfatase A-like enzyme
VKRCALLVAGSLLVTACGGSVERPRNVILISIDTLRRDHLGCYGYPADVSPTIDRLAAGGVRFADASSAAPWTLPSHTTMLTGLYPGHHGVRDYAHQLPPERVTLAEVLAEHGFQTFCVLNTFGIADPRFEILQGFAPEQRRYVRETETGEQGQKVILNSGPEVLAEARAFLEGRDRDRPFFLFVHLYDPHTDFTPEPAYRERFVDPYGGELDGSTGQLLWVRQNGLTLGPADLRFLKQLYAAEIRQTDDELGEFVGFLDGQGLMDDTLIAVVSDHGEEFQEHGGLLHGRTQYEELLAVPFVLHGPGVPAGTVVEEPVSLVDLMPTLLGRLGLPVPPGLDGIDLASSWSGGTLPERVLFAEADHNNVVDGQSVLGIRAMARRGDQKLLLDVDTGRTSLFDLARDPGETEDLAGARADAVRELLGALERHRASGVAARGSGKELSPDESDLLKQLGYGGDDER